MTNTEVLLCLICGDSLGELEISCRQSWHYSCEKCQICQAEGLSHEIIINSLAKGLPIAHTGCIESQAMRDLKDKTIPIRLEQIDQLNHEITKQWKIEPRIDDIESLYKILEKLQTAAANVSIMLEHTKSKIRVREAQDYRTKTKEQKDQEKQIEHAKAQTHAEKEKRTATLAAEREDPALKLRRKAIESYVAMGLTKEQAEATIIEIEAKRKTERIQ